MRLLRRTSSRGFSLLEMLMAVAVLSTMAAGAVFTISNVTRSAENTKLQRDVAVINNAIRTYLLNGGTFLRSELANPATVLTKLKKRASADSAKEIAGLRGSMADARLTFEMQTPKEAAGGQQRARFVSDPVNPHFIVQSRGEPGIRRFILDASLAEQDFGTEDRRANLKLAKKDPWVWDYDDSSARRQEPSLPPRRDVNEVNPNPPDVGNITLNPPDFSIASATYALWTYPKMLALLPTNPSGTSQIFYSVDSGPFIPYAGPFDVHPGTTVTGVSLSLDPDHYDDSPSSSRTYTTTPVTPWPALLFTKSRYDYFELGGEAAPGTPPPLPSGSVNGTAFIINSALIPAAYQNSSVYRFVWTLDGTDPLTSGAAQWQADFSGGFGSLPIPVPLEAFGRIPTTVVSVAVKGENKAIVTNSSVVGRTLNAESLRLQTPLISVDGRDVTLALDVSRRDMPKDARIFYTTDGTDPGVDAAGNPQRGIAYNGEPFTLQGLTGSSHTIRARAYAPVKYPQFFTASNAERRTLVLPAATDVFIGGNFVNSGGSLLRNIARLNNSGQVDPRFNTGAGASEDSLVGIVRQSSAGILTGGDFETLNGSPRPGVVRLNLNGSVDTGFDADLTAN